MIRKLIRKIRSKIRSVYFNRKTVKLFGSFGKNSSISVSCKQYVYPKNIFIGNCSSVGVDTYLIACEAGKIIIKDGSIIAPRCKIYTRTHNYDSENLKAIPYDHVQLCGDVVIEEGVWIGESVIIMPGVTIGRGAVIGGGTVVAKDIPAYAVAVGNPAVIKKYRDPDRFEKLLDSQSFSINNKAQKEFIPKAMKRNSDSNK